MLVRIVGVVLLGHVVAEQEIGERLEAVCVAAGNVERDRVLVADVLAERLTRVAVEDDDPGRPLQAGEEVVLAAEVVVEPANHARPRERDVRLPGGPRQRALTPQLAEPAPLVLDATQRDAEQPFDHRPARL